MGSKSCLPLGYLKVVALVWITVLGRRGVLGIGQGDDMRLRYTHINVHGTAVND